MEQTEARTRNPASPERQLEVAQNVSDWFVPYLYGVDLETDVSLPRRTRARMTAIVGKYPTPQLLSRIREVFANVPADHVHNTVLYFAGYPDEALAALADGDMSVTVGLLESSGEAYRPVAPEKTVARRALKETVRFDTEDNTDSPDDAVVDPDAAPEVLSVKLSDDPVRDYMRTISKFSLLKAEDEVTLSAAIEAGLFAQERKHRLIEEGVEPRSFEIRELRELERIGERSKERMINSNLRLVVSIAKQYTGRGLQFLDLIQEGNAGLMRAVEKFDYQKGFKFSTYGTSWIRQAIQRSIPDTGREIRLPVHMYEKIQKMSRFRQQFSAENSRYPSDEEVADELDVTVEKVRDLKEYSRTPVSLNMKIGDDDAEFGDLISDNGATNPENAVDIEGVNSAVASFLSDLDENEVAVLSRRYGLGGQPRLSAADVAKQLGLSPIGVRNIEFQAIQKLRIVAQDNVELREFLS